MKKETCQHGSTHGLIVYVVFKQWSKIEGPDINFILHNNVFHGFVVNKPSASLGLSLTETIFK